MCQFVWIKTHKDDDQNRVHFVDNILKNNSIYTVLKMKEIGVIVNVSSFHYYMHHFDFVKAPLHPF